MDKLSLFLSPEMWPGVSVKRLWSLFWLQQVCILNTGSVILTIIRCDAFAGWFHILIVFAGISITYFSPCCELQILFILVSAMCSFCYFFVTFMCSNKWQCSHESVLLYQTQKNVNSMPMVFPLKNLTIRRTSESFFCQPVLFQYLLLFQNIFYRFSFLFFFHLSNQ